MMVPWHFNNRTCTDDTNHVCVGFCQLLDQVDLVLRNAEMLAVKTFCLAFLVQSEEKQNHIRTAGKIYGLFFHSFVFLAIALITAYNSSHRDSAGLQHVLDGIYFCGIYHGRTCALVSWVKSEVTDYGCLNLRSNRKDSVLIFQKNCTVLAGKTCQLVVLLMKGFLVCHFFIMLCILGGGKYQIKKLVYALVNVLLADLAAFYAGKKLSCCIKSRSRHFQGRTVLYTERMVVRSTPVSDNRAFEAPLVTENVFQQMLVFVGVNTVYLVVAAHNRFRATLFDGNLKTGEVDLTESSLIYHCVHCHTAKLLAVYSEMFCAGCCSCALHTADKSSCHFSGKIGIFGKILEVTSTERISLNVQSRSKKNVYVFFHGFFTKGNAYPLLQLFIPAVCHSCRCRKTGCRYCWIDSQMISCSSLFTHTIRSV